MESWVRHPGAAITPEDTHPHSKSNAGESWLPLLSFQSIHSGATRPSGETDLSLVPGASVRALREGENFEASRAPSGVSYPTPAPGFKAAAGM